jgi:hypothetical protein
MPLQAWFTVIRVRAGVLMICSERSSSSRARLGASASSVSVVKKCGEKCAGFWVESSK